MRWARYLSIMAVFLSCVAAGLSAYTVIKIQSSRHDAALESCRQRNEDRKLNRKDLRRSLNFTKTLPEQTFELLGVSTQKAIKDAEKDLREAADINCEEYADMVTE